MKKILTLTVLLMMCSLGLLAQTSKVIADINEKNGQLRPATQWLDSDEEMENFFARMDMFSRWSLENLREEVERDHTEATEILEAYKTVVGKKKGKKADKRLARYFTNVEQAKAVFSKASQIEKRSIIASKVIDSRLNSTGTSRPMPMGKLLRFNYMTSNGFAGYREEISLVREGDKGMLRVEIQRMRDQPGQNEEPYTVEVDDSVLQRVRDMVEEGKLYDVNKRYMPEIDIMDASNWSMDFKFEGGIIESSGYAAGPDHSETLRQVLQYLYSIYDEKKPQNTGGTTPNTP